MTLSIKTKGRINVISKGNIGYFFVSNDANIQTKLKENTKSSLTREVIIFGRYSPQEITNILKSRIEEGALYEDKLEEGALELISAASVKEGQDARYALTLLSNVAKEAEKKGLDKITKDLVKEVNQILLQNNMREIIRELPELHLEILKIAYELRMSDEKINSKIIWDNYQDNPYLPERDFSRIYCSTFQRELGLLPE